MNKEILGSFFHLIFLFFCFASINQNVNANFSFSALLMPKSRKFSLWEEKVKEWPWYWNLREKDLMISTVKGYQPKNILREADCMCLVQIYLQKIDGVF